LRHRVFTLRRQYLDAASKYVPESDDEEIDIHEADQKDYATQDSIAAAQKAAEEKAAAEKAAAQYHKVRSGDTLSGIAKRYGTTVNKIISLNPGLTTKTTLKIGRNIRVK
jgi:LysM repeat protein